MSTIRPVCSVHLSAALILNESELAALGALAGYGVDEFLKVFYEKMGRHYLEPHEKGLCSLFTNVQEHAASIIQATECARRAFNENKPRL